jgi:hypothetical protein
MIETFDAIFWITQLLSIARTVEYSAQGKVSESAQVKKMISDSFNFRIVIRNICFWRFEGLSVVWPYFLMDELFA